MSESPRFRRIRVIGKCEHCGMPLPLNGPQRTALCTHCLEDNQRTEAFWGELANVVDCYPRTDEYDNHDIDVEVTTAGAGDAVDAPDWLRDLASAVRRLHGVEGEAQGGGKELKVTAAARGVTMRCPECSGGLDLTGESRQITCDYCHQEIYIPDDLWRRLHPVKKAEPWFIEYEGPNALERRRAPSLREWRQERPKRSIFDRKNVREIPHRELKVLLDRLYKERVDLRKMIDATKRIGGTLVASVIFAGVMSLLFPHMVEGSELGVSPLVLGPMAGLVLFLIVTLRAWGKRKRLAAMLDELEEQIAAVKAEIAARGREKAS